MRLHVTQQLLEIPHGSMWLHSKFHLHEHYKLRDASLLLSDSFPTQIGPDKSSRLCLLHSDVLEVLKSATTRAEKPLRPKTILSRHRRVKGEGGGRAGQVIDGSEVVKISLSAWPGSDCTGERQTEAVAAVFAASSWAKVTELYLFFIEKFAQQHLCHGWQQRSGFQPQATNKAVLLSHWSHKQKIKNLFHAKYVSFTAQRYMRRQFA